MTTPSHCKCPGPVRSTPDRSGCPRFHHRWPRMTTPSHCKCPGSVGSISNRSRCSRFHSIDGCAWRRYCYSLPTLSISRRNKQSEERAALIAVGWMRSLGIFSSLLKLIYCWRNNFKPIVIKNVFSSLVVVFHYFSCKTFTWYAMTINYNYC